MFKVNIYYNHGVSIVFRTENQYLCRGSTSKFLKNFKKAGCLHLSSRCQSPTPWVSVAEEHHPVSCAWDGLCRTLRPVPPGPEPHKVVAACGLGLAPAQLTPARAPANPGSVSGTHVCTYTHTHTRILLIDRADESLFLVITVQTTHSPGCAETLRTNQAMC